MQDTKKKKKWQAETYDKRKSNICKKYKWKNTTFDFGFQFLEQKKK